MLISLIIFLVLLSLLVFIHELGHFMVAKWTGMRVDEFGIGFPPRLLKYRRGDTLYSLNAIPLGGYVKIHGENPEDKDEDPRSFQNRSVWARLLVIIAGVTMNLAFAYLVMVVAFSFGFVSIGQNLEEIPGASVKESQVLVAEVQPGSPGEKANLAPGDIIKTLKDSSGTEYKITTVDSLQEYNKAHQTKGQLEVQITYDRVGDIRKTQVTMNQTGPALGIGIQAFNTVRVPFWRAPAVAARECGYILQATWDALRGFANKLFIHAELDEKVSGPVGIYQATASATKQGLIPTIFLMVALSLNLALLNILPIPALDGGKLVFLFSEAVFRRRVVAERIENAISLVGISLLIVLILIVSVRDVIRLF